MVVGSGGRGGGDGGGLVCLDYRLRGKTTRRTRSPDGNARPRGPSRWHESDMTRLPLSNLFCHATYPPYACNSQSHSPNTVGGLVGAGVGLPPSGRPASATPSAARAKTSTRSMGPLRLEKGPRGPRILTALELSSLFSQRRRAPSQRTFARDPWRPPR